MRTTLDLDPRVLAAARSRVHSGQAKSIGEAVSTLALSGLTLTEPRPPTRPDGIVVLPGVPGRVLTDEMVAEAMLDE